MGKQRAGIVATTPDSQDNFWLKGVNRHGQRFAQAMKVFPGNWLNTLARFVVIRVSGHATSIRVTKRFEKSRYNCPDCIAASKAIPSCTGSAATRWASALA